MIGNEKKEVPSLQGKGLPTETVSHHYKPKLLLFSCSIMSNTLPPHILQHAGFLVLHHLLELAQTQVHWVDDGIQPSHSLMSPSHPAFNLSQHQGLFQ